MRQIKHMLCLVVSASILWTPSQASGARWDILYRFCFDEIIVIDEIPEWIPVGCEIVDCCPGCPGPPIDWRIRFESGPVESMILQFENLLPDQAQKLGIKGNAKWLDGNRLQIGRGETILSGFSVDPKARPPVAVPSIAMDKDAIRQSIEAMDKDSKEAEKDIGSMDFTVEQMLGPFVVNEFRLRYIITRCPPPTLPTDQIDLNSNAANDSAVVLLDARRSSGCVDDEIQRGNNIISLGSVLSNASCNSEVAVFSDDDAMQLVTPVNAWTNSLGDVLPVDLTPNLLQAPVNVRLLRSGALATAQGDIANANLLYNTNHAGIAFNATFTDLSSNTTAVNLIGTNSANMCTGAWLNAVTTSAFFTPNQLNVYYVNGAFTGLNCIFNRNIIVIGTTANNQTLAHEFGHSFSLGHTNGVPGFGTNNVMIGGGAGRTHFSEGQDFRMNVNANSTINANGVRTGPTRNCPDGTTSNTCPALSLDAVPN